MSKITACAVAVGVGLATFSLSATERPGERVSPRQAGVVTPRVDALGDPLPAGAVLRLGTIRLRGWWAAVAFSPDGKRLASGGEFEPIFLWDPKTGKEMQTLPNPSGVWALAFSADGKLLAVVGATEFFYLWDPATGKEMGRLEVTRGCVRDLAFAPRGHLLVTADMDCARLWNAAEKKMLHTLETEKAAVHAVAFSPDGRSVAAACDDAMVRVWDTTGKLRYRLKGHAGDIKAVRYSRDGKHLVTAGPKETCVWDTAKGKSLGGLGKTPVGAGSAAFSPDGKLLALGTIDGRVRLWDWATLTEIFQTRRHHSGRAGLAFSPDCRTLASAEGILHLWDTATGKQKLALPGHQGAVIASAYTPDGRAVVTCAGDGTARVWDARTGKELRQIEVAAAGEKTDTDRRPGHLRGGVVSPDGKFVAVVRGDDVMTVRDLATGKEVRRYQGRCLAFSPDGQGVAVGGKAGEKGFLRLYDRATGALRREFPGHETPVVNLAFAPDGQALISHRMLDPRGNFGGQKEDETKYKFLQVWDVATGKQRRDIAEGTIPTLSPDGRTMACAAGLSRVKLWETTTGDYRGELAGHEVWLFAMAFSSDCRTLATTGMDGRVRLWDPYTLREIGQLVGHRSLCSTIAFSPDGTRLVSGSWDSTALVWDVSRYTKRPVRIAELTDAELKACWDDLGGSAEQAYRAIGKMLASPKRAVTFLGGRVQPAPTVTPRRLAALIAELSSGQFKTREQALRELERLGEAAAPAVHRALAGDAPLEVKRRLEILRKKLDAAGLSAETLRPVRAVEVLERIGTPEARRVLARLDAEGGTEARLTREAAAALRRLKAP
jgi:WD40 repeat protein